MPSDKRILHRTQEWLAAGFLVLAIGFGSYSVSDTFSGELNFIEVGWWNVRDLSTSSRSPDELRVIAKIIKDSGVDVFAIGELNDPEALREITQELGTSWEFADTGYKIGRTPNSSEYYGFIWDSDVVDIVGDVTIDPDPGDKIDRQPAYATFSTNGGNFDFTVIAVHVTWGKRVADRKDEIKALAEVWNRVQAANLAENDLILVGDFNRNIGDDSFGDLMKISGVIRANQDSGPTHISSKSTYDQIFISTEFTKEWTGEFETIRFDEKYFGDDEEANLVGSDHRPVYIRLFVSDKDDD